MLRSHESAGDQCGRSPEYQRHILPGGVSRSSPFHQSTLGTTKLERYDCGYAEGVGEHVRLPRTDENRSLWLTQPKCVVLQALHTCNGKGINQLRDCEWMRDDLL